MNMRRLIRAAGLPVSSLMSWSLLVVLACNQKVDASHSDSAKAGAGAPAVATPASAADDTVGCGFVANKGHEHPDSLLAEFLARDGNGEFAQSSSWRDEVVTCPGHAPGWDGLTLISSYRTSPLPGSTDTMRFLVTYARIGLLEQDADGYMVKNDVGEERDTVVLTHTMYGWRVDGWDQEPHLLPVGALKLPTMNTRDKAKLRTMLKP